MLCIAAAQPGLWQNSLPDALIVVAGIAGLSAALEAGRAGARVVIVDQSTVGGGHAILSNGAECMVDTPLQASRNIKDNLQLAERDFLNRGGDARPEWVARYVRETKAQLYDWFAGLGVTFDFWSSPRETVSRDFI
jgi:predicted oxidoreductase